MRLQELTKTSGEWLRGTGPDSDIVISSRIRLARNLAQFPFGNRADKHEQQEIEELLCQYFQKLKGKWKFHYFNVEELDNLDRQLLVERQLISRELADSEGVRGVAFVRKENISVMVNEEDIVKLSPESKFNTILSEPDSNLGSPETENLETPTQDESVVLSLIHI